MAHLQWHAENASLMTVTHIALLGTHLHVFSQKLLETIIRRHIENTNTLRTKDMGCVALMLALVDFKSSARIEEDMFRKYLEKMKSLKDSRDTKERINIIKCLCYLMIKGSWDMELLHWALEKKSLQKTFGNSMEEYNREIYFIDSFVKINLRGQYQGPQLSDIQRKILTERFAYTMPTFTSQSDVSEYDKVFRDILNVTKRQYKYVAVENAVPHYVRAG